MPVRAWPRWRMLMLVVLGAVACSASGAADAPKIKTFRLELKEMKGIEHGKAAVVKGEAGKEPHRFYVEGLNMNTPVAVLVRPVREADEVALRLTKYAWNQALREGTAKGEPLAFKFRTEGEFQISVTSPKPGTPYRLLVWAGDEVKPQLRPVVVKASEYTGEKESSSSVVLWVIAAALLAIVGLLVVLVLRRKSS